MNELDGQEWKAKESKEERKQEGNKRVDREKNGSKHSSRGGREGGKEEKIMGGEKKKRAGQMERNERLPEAGKERERGERIMEGCEKKNVRWERMRGWGLAKGLSLGGGVHSLGHAAR